MKLVHRAFALIGAVAVASTLAACGGGAPEIDADDNGGTNENGSNQSQEQRTSIASINADNVEGLCEQVFGSIEDAYGNLQLDVPADAMFGYDIDAEQGGWGDEYFPQDGSKPATIRCQAHVFYKNDSGTKEDLSVSISVAASENDPRGNTDTTVAAEGMTAGIQSYTRSGKGMEESMETETVESSVAEQFLTDNVLTMFTP